MNFELVMPATVKEMLAALKNLQTRDVRFGAGFTDLLLELRKNGAEDLTVINLAQLRDKAFTGIRPGASGYRLGAGVTARQIAECEALKDGYPALYEAARALASTQIRQVATAGGNLCTASPSGDIACALVALEAVCEILHPDGKKKKVPIGQFFTGPRKTVLGKLDLLYGIHLPANKPQTKKVVSGFIKVGARKAMECSVVSLAYHIQTDEAGKILHTGAAMGAVAPTIRFPEKACAFLRGKNIRAITGAEAEAFAAAVAEYAAPISDIRATAWYRKEVLFNISKSIIENTET